ncbi:MAG: serine/threonine protein kinase [Thaumarchaeota archaeon]|nr:serine/threonine protein kinase [Nitrososphaerota archaeon]
MTRSFISTKHLSEKPYSSIIGFPRATARQVARRISEMTSLGIDAVSFTGPTTIGRLGVLGKGYVGVVVLGKKGRKLVAVKIRRTDSQRNSMRGEAEMLRAANSVRVGPKFYSSSRNCLVMEYLKGRNIGSWAESLGSRGSANQVKVVAKKILEDCYRLDCASIDHGELSSISKHVIIGESQQNIIDFEGASTKRRASNVTAATQAVYIGSGISKKIRRVCSVPQKDIIIPYLRKYKQDGSRENFEALLKLLKMPTEEPRYRKIKVKNGGIGRI